MFDDSDDEDHVQGELNAPRKVVVRAARFDEDLVALEALEAAAAAAAAAPEQQVVIAKLTFRRCQTVRSSDVARRSHRIAFGRLVDLLAQRQPGLVIRTFKILEFGLLSFPDEHFRREDLERLFRDVLPNHPTLERIELAGCSLPTRYVSLLASSVPAGRLAPLRELALPSIVSGDRSGVQAICDMLRRDVPLKELWLGWRLDSADCRRIFRSLATNTHLEGLAIRPLVLEAGTLCLASEAAPALRVLHVDGPFPPEGVESVARHLRTNETLVELRIPGTFPSPELVHAVAHVLDAHNFTLRTFGAVGPYPSLTAEPDRLAGSVRGSSIPGNLRRNDRIRRALERLTTYRVAPAALVPRVLEMVSCVPTLLYRFVRRGNTNALVGSLLPNAGAHRQEEGSGGAATS